MNKFAEYVQRRDILNWLEANDYATSATNIDTILETGFDKFVSDPALAEGLEAKTVVEE